MFLIALIVLVATIPGLPARADADQTEQFEVFRRVASLNLEPLLVHFFADQGRLSEVDALPPDGVLRLDFEGDGKTDALAWREGTNRVAAIREKGSFRPDATRPDSLDTCIVVDLSSDGIPDRVVRLRDTNVDGKADVQEIYEIGPGYLGATGVGVFVGFDVDGRGLPIHLTEYGYSPERDMWLSRFDGNVYFVAGHRDEGTGRWSSAYENPFCFYDHDGDGHADEAVRYEGSDLRLESLRWSFDLDGRAGPLEGPGYDFSITAIGPILAPPAFTDSVRLLDGGFLRFVSWARARDLARRGAWRSALLVWNEDDHNVYPTPDDSGRERWEGVIAEPYMGFPVVGGPPCGWINKRYELDRDASGRLGLYVSGIDDRIHLLGSERGDLTIDLPGDPPIQRQVRMKDTDLNGFFDTWSYTAGGDEARNRTVHLEDRAVRILPIDAAILREFWTGALTRARERSVKESEALARSSAGGEPNEVERWWLSARGRNEPLAVRAARSLQADRFLHDVMCWEMGGGFLSRSAVR